MQTLSILPELFAVCRLAPDAPVPAWAAGPFVSITRTPDELSAVCPAASVPNDIRCERGWRCLRVAGPLDLAQVGVLASLVVPLAEAGGSVFVVSTFDTDYLLVREADLVAAVEALRRHGHLVR
jgi:hypothetical protein